MRAISDTYPIARKEHQCYLCGGKIAKGEKYHKQTSVDGAEIGTCITHLACEDLADKLKMYQTCGYGEGLTDIDFECCLDDYITEHYDENEAAFIKRYNVAGRALYVSGDLEKEEAK